MSFVTPLIALIVFICVILAAAFISYRSDASHFPHSKLKIFIGCLAGLGIFVTFLFYYSVVELQQEEMKINIIKQTARVNGAFIDGLLKEMLNASNVVPNFVISMMPLSSCHLDFGEDENTSKACIERFALSYKIFTIWQDTIFSDKYINVDDETYISNFLQRAHSDQLKHEWEMSKLNFDKKTQVFGDLLFEYSAKIQEQTPEAYIEAAKELISNPVYQEIIKS